MSSKTITKRLDNVVYLLGAGFSAPLKIPVVSNFLEKSKDMLAIAPDRYGKFVDVFKTIDKMSKSKNYFNSDLFNIEEILSILEMGEELSNEAERSLFKEYIVDVVQYYTPKLELQDYLENWRYFVFGRENPNLTYYGFFVGSLLSLVLSQNGEGDFFCGQSGEQNRPARYSVITLNYDMVLENCFSYLTMERFRADRKFGFSPEIEKSEEQFLQNTHLAKLHGSVDTKVIVPPTWNKGLHDEIKPAWQLAYKVLTEANHIRMIGYSLPIADAYIKYLLKAAIIHCERLKSIDVLCLDPDGSVKDRYDKLICFPNYKFKNSSVIDYLAHNQTACLKENKGGQSLHMNCLEATHKDFFDK